MLDQLTEGWSEAGLADLDAEMHVVTAAFVSPEMMDKVVEEANPRWFYSESWRNLLAGLRSCMRDGVQVFDSQGYPDIDLFKHKLGHVETQLAKDIINGVPYGASWEIYLERVKHLAARRATLRTFLRYGDRITKGDDLEDVLDNTTSDLLRIRDGQQRGLNLDLGRDVPELMQRVLAIRKGGIPGYRTGFPKLDEFLGGAVKGRNGIIAGRPGNFKSTMSVEIAYHLAHQGRRVYYYSTEMRAADYLERIGLGLLGLNSHAIPHWTHIDYNSYESKLEEISLLPLVIDDTPGLTPARLRRRMRIVQPDVLIVDYVQRMKADSGVTAEYERVSEVSTEVDGFKKEFGIPVISVCQLKRLGDVEDGEPDMEHLRGSGVLEQDADWILLLWRNGQSDKLHVKCPKNRFGPAPRKATFEIKQNCAWLTPK